MVSIFTSSINKLPKIFAIVNSTGAAASDLSSLFGPFNLVKDTTVGFWDCLVILSRILKAETTDAEVKFGLLNATGLPLIAPYSTTT